MYNTPDGLFCSLESAPPPPPVATKTFQTFLAYAFDLAKRTSGYLDCQSHTLTDADSDELRNVSSWDQQRRVPPPETPSTQLTKAQTTGSPQRS